MQLGQDVKDKLAAIVDRVLRTDASLVSKVICGNTLGEGSKGLTASVLGIKYKVVVENNDVKVFSEDPLNREEDSSRLIIYAFNTIERALEGKMANQKGRLISLAQLPGGQTAKLYEKRMTNFLVTEVDGAKPEEIEATIVKIGGNIVEHSNATWSVEITPFNGVRIRTVYWQGEEEMPSSAAVLLGEEIKEVNLPIEELIIIMEMAINRFVLFYRKETGKKPTLFHSLYL